MFKIILGILLFICFLVLIILIFLIYKTLKLQMKNNLIKSKQNLKNHSLLSTNQKLIELIQKIKEHYNKINNTKNEMVFKIENKLRIIQRKEETLFKEIEKVPLKKTLIKNLQEKLINSEKQSNEFIESIKKDYSAILANNEFLDNLYSLNKNLALLKNRFEQNISLYSEDKEKINDLFNKININIRKIRVLLPNLDKQNEILILLNKHKEMILKTISILNYSPIFWTYIKKTLPLCIKNLKNIYFEKEKELKLNTLFDFAKIENWYKNKEKEILASYNKFNFELVHEEVILTLSTLEDTKQNILKQEKIRDFLSLAILEFKDSIKKFIDNLKQKRVLAKKEYRNLFEEMIEYFEKLILYYETDNDIAYSKKLIYFKKNIVRFEKSKQKIEELEKQENIYTDLNIKKINLQLFSYLKEIINNFIFKLNEKQVVLTQEEKKQINELKSKIIKIFNSANENEKNIKIEKLINDISNYSNIFNKYLDKIILEKLFHKLNNFRNNQNKLNSTMNLAENYSNSGNYSKALNNIFSNLNKNKHFKNGVK
ncbi:ligand-binding sensor domain-containing protein [[Mycoplasma] collis]|uniref:hypothetical protein n=1 Tax=[Mycoplasma] collis TaxID=2127 RepID=UPI00051BE4C5|nr:hypothetical protein [[Mycoplasma] collis]